MRRWAWIVALGLAACSPAASPPDAQAPAPSASMASNFSHCTWGEVRGAGASMWSFACEGDRVIADESLPGFVRETTTAEGSYRATVAQFFDVAPGASLDSILPAVRAASPAEGNENCAFAPVAGREGWYEFRPTSAWMEAYNRAQGIGDEAPSEPCGVLGPSEGGGRYFFMLPGAADRAVVVHEPSDMPIFDSDTLRAAS